MSRKKGINNKRIRNRCCCCCCCLKAPPTVSLPVIRPVSVQATLGAGLAPKRLRVQRPGEYFQEMNIFDDILSFNEIFKGHCNQPSNLIKPRMVVNGHIKCIRSYLLRAPSCACVEWHRGRSLLMSTRKWSNYCLLSVTASSSSATKQTLMGCSVALTSIANKSCI